MQLFDNMGIPAFLSKLRKMVDDQKTDNLICWSKDGKSFIIRNEVEFWYTLLPAYYKHNNMSSFVRQLNMYGFHKISNFDANTDENDKVEYQFFHPYFQRDEPDLLKSIKRKVTNSKVVPGDRTVHDPENGEQLTKVLTDVKKLQSRQVHVDGVLNNLKQENAVLWRELAVLRQKHQKQQQIVNKLIQFLVTIVQPATRMGGLGVKRRYPLMINENPMKKQKSNSSSDGPTIHELDSAELHPEELFKEAEVEPVVQLDATPLNDMMVVESPPSTSQQPSLSSQSLLSVPDDLDEIPSVEPDVVLEPPSLDMDKQGQANNTVLNVDELLTDPGISDEAANISNLALDDEFGDEEPILNDDDDDDRIFLSHQSQDSLLTNLLQGSYNENALMAAKKDSNVAGSSVSSSNVLPDLTVATRDPNLAFTKLNSSGGLGGVSVDDLYNISDHVDSHIGSTQSELEQLKDFFRGCNGIDTSYLLNLFNDAPSYGLTLSQGDEAMDNDLLSGTEVAPYDASKVDFNELLDDSTDLGDIKPEFVLVNSTESLNTPELSSNLKPFPFDKANKK